MASAGPLNPTSVTQTGLYNWTNPSDVEGSSAYASCAIPHSTSSSILSCEGYGFVIPGGATIDGIVVTFKSYGANNSNISLTARLLKAGVAGGTSYSQGQTTTATVYTLGSAVNLWGNTLAASDINASGFGVEIYASNSSGTLTLSAYLQNVQITVYYTTSSGARASCSQLFGF